jgi:Zn finger protein HypA/HybF involved in hydrogenase expression
MIKIGFDVAVAVLLSAAVLFILFVWLRERVCRGPEPGIEEDQAGNMRQCPYCRHVCVDDRHQKIMVCPVCKSYFDEEIL